MIPWTAPRVRSVLLVRVDYTDPSGVPAVARWCGPKEKIPSGLPSPGLKPPRDIEGDGKTHPWDARIRGFAIVEDLGSLSSHTQTPKTLRLQVNLHGPATDPTVDKLYLPARDGRWIYKRVRAWRFDLVSGESEIIFDGTASRNPSPVEFDGFGFDASDDPLGQGAAWPQTRLPTADQINTVQPDLGSVMTNGVENLPTGTADWQPEATTNVKGYQLSPETEGRYVGTVYGWAQADSESYREIYYYGSNNAGSGDTFYFFHVSPQPYVDVLRVWYEDNSGGVTEITTSSLAISFTNHNWRNGPTGTNVRLRLSSSVIDWPHTQPFPRVVARMGGSNASVAATHYAGEIEEHTLASSTDATTALDAVVADAFDLLGLGTALHPGAGVEIRSLPDFSTTGRVECAVPARAPTEPLTLRKALGALGKAYGFDVTTRRDGQGIPKVFLAVRRPHPGRPEADYVVREGDLASGPHEAPSWAVLDDPGGHYAHRVTTRSPSMWTQPRTVDPTAILPSLTLAWADFDDVSAGLDGWERSATEELRLWLPGGVLPGQLGDPLPFRTLAGHLANERQQRQVVIRALHGWKSNAFELAETLRYEIPGLPVSVGQIRKKRPDPIREVVEVTSIHVVFFPHTGTTPEDRRG